MKTKFKVAELPHVFFNDGATDGATAGEHAQVIGRTMLHNRNVPAASFLADAVASNGQTVALVWPSYNETDARWIRSTVAAAVPETKYSRVTLDAWPYKGPSSSRMIRAYEFENGARQTESVRVLFREYLEGIEATGRDSVASECDPDGAQVTNMPRYFAECSNLLALVWKDKKAQTAARRELATMADRWCLDSAGKTDIYMVRAIATRVRLAERIADAMPRLFEYFNASRAADTLAKKMALALGTSYGKLESDIAAVLRAERMPAGIPKNPAAVVAADRAAVRKIERLQESRNLLARAWRDARANNYSGTLARYNLSELESGRAHALPWIKRGWLELSEFIRARHRRVEMKTAVHEFETACRAYDETTPRFLALQNDPNPDYENFVDHYEQTIERRVSAGRAIVEHAADYSRLPESRPDTNGWRARTSLEWKQSEQAIIQVEIDRTRAWRAANRTKINAAEYRAGIAKLASEAINTPRAAVAALQAKLESITRPTYYGESHATKYGDYLETLQNETRAAIADADVLIGRVTALQEFANGGECPGPGDWLRVKGDNVRTTRNVTVPAKSVRAALRWIDAQPAGACDWRAAGITLGDLYQLIGRDETGTIRVGCHSFTADAVAYIRDALA